MKQAFTNHQCLSLKEIKVYLNEEINKQDRERFNQHFSTCSLCVEVKESFHLVDEEIEKDIVELKQAIITTTISRKRTIRRLFISRIAASILFLITASATLFYWNATRTDRLYQKYFQPYEIAEAIPSQNGGEGNELKEYNVESFPESLELALENYHARKYKESLPHFRAFLKIQPQNAYVTFLYALANLVENHTDIAIDSLKTVRINDTDLYEDATWYLALAYLRKKDKASALYYLKALEKIEGGKYEEKTKDLMKRLRQSVKIN